MAERRPSTLHHNQLGNRAHNALGGQPLILILVLVRRDPRVIPQRYPLWVNTFLSKRFPNPFRRHD